MVTIGLILLIILWFLLGVKTWAFVITDLADSNPDRFTVISSFFAGLIWPLTYAVLSLILIFGVASQSIGYSLSKIKGAWCNRGS